MVFVPFIDGKPAGAPEDCLDGFLLADGHAVGRPAGVALDSNGALLVADNVGNAVWRVAPREQVGPAVSPRVNRAWSRAMAGAQDIPSNHASAVTADDIKPRQTAGK
ncbi:protein of unknown function (plasmid) [Caballeronia sp. S22]